VNNKSVLIIGASGFIGHHLFDFYNQYETSCIGIDKIGDDVLIINELHKDLPKILKEREFDFCINAAGSGNVFLSNQEPYNDFQLNVNNTISILDNIRLFQNNCKYIHISSAAVYGNPEILPIGEEAEKKPISSYGWNKLMGENICFQYNKIYHIPIIILRPFSIYGPGLRKQIIWDLYQKIRNNAVVELFGTGDETRDFIYISDFMHVVDLIMDKSNFDCDIYNIGNGQQTKISEIASFFTSKITDKSVIFNNINRFGDPLYWWADISKIKEIGFSPKVDINTGLKYTLNWLKDDYK